MKAYTLASLGLAGLALAVPQQGKGKGAKTGAPKSGGKSGGAGGLGGLLGGLTGGGAPGSDPLGGLAGLLGSGGGSAVGGLVTSVLNRGYGKVADPAGAAAKRQVLKSRVTLTSGKPTTTVKVRYGPYKVPNVNHKNALGEAGALYNYPHINVEKPCSGNCMILGLNAGLEYADGKNANIDTGMWLHHFVLLAVGPGRSDATCSHNRASLPHMLVGSNSTNSERIFSSGNERTPAFPVQWKVGKDAGMKVATTDKFSMIVDLMNTNPEDKVAYLTITYDIVDGHPAEVDEIKPVWFDVAQCGTSEVIPKQQTGAWHVDAPVWTPNFDGEVIGAAGHLHDGGTSVHLIVDGKIVCDSTAKYGESPEFVGKGMGGGHHGGDSPHISSMSLCIAGTDSFQTGKLSRNSKWILRANYDYNKFPGMSHDGGKQDNVMGIAIMFVRVTKR